MPEILSINPQAAKFDPAAEFGSPADLAATSGLTRGQKIAALERWAQQILDRLAATSEGMATRATSGADTARLDEVNAAIAELKQKTEE